MTEYYDPRRRWMDHPYRACKGVDQEVIFSGPNSCWVKPSSLRAAIWEQWIEDHCKVCPVLELCARDTLGEEHGIWGGMTQHERHRARRRQDAAARKWPAAKREFFGKEVHDLRRQDWHYGRITNLTGLTRKLAIELQQEYEALLEQRAAERAEKERQDREKAAQEAEKALAGRTVHALPDEPGQRDLWVRHRGQVFDATYRGHSEDGQWVRAEIRQIQAIPWIPVRDCRIYRAVPKKIQAKGRTKYGRAA